MKLLAIAVMAGIALTSAQTLAKADVEITWEKPEKFRDVKPTMQSRKKFRQQTFAHLEEYLNELAQSLPDGQTLALNVTDLDLAGQVWPASFVGFRNAGGDVRLVKSVDIPRMTFSYQLKDQEGNIVQSSDETKLKDMGFQQRFNPFFDNEALRYEKNMLRAWFKTEFPELLVKK